MRKLLQGLLCAAALLPLGSAYADLSNIRINGFGQVVGGTTMSNDHAAQGYGADPKFDQESLYALQISAPLTSKMTATAQLLGRGTEDFKPKFAWAYLKYQISDDWSVKLGRQRIPIFYFSETLDVGVSYPWLRPPTAVYGLAAGVTNFDAITVGYSHQWGKLRFEPVLSYGQWKGGINYAGSESTFTGTQMAVISLTTTYDEWISLHTNYATWKSSVTGSPMDGLIAGLNSAGLGTAANDLAINGDTLGIIDLGAEINYAKWQVIAEYDAARSFHNFIPHSHVGFLTVGRHFGRFEPLLTYVRSNNSSSSQALNEIPDTSGNQQFRAIVGSILKSQRTRENYYIFDLRYDLANNVALKFSYTAFNSSIAGTASSNLLSAGVAYSF